MAYQKIIKKVYTDLSSPGSLGGVKRLYHASRAIDPRITQADVKSFLKSQRSYTLHVLRPKKFKRRRILAPRSKIILSCDLADVQNLKKYNKNTRYVLLCVDVFSRFLQAIPMLKKDSASSLAALKSILESDASQGYTRLFTDQGSEFINKKVQEYLSSRGIKQYSISSNEIKASLAERIIRTFKNKIYRFFTENNTYNFLDVLPKIVDTYNHTPHSGIGNKTPAEVHNYKNLQDIIKQFAINYNSNGKSVSPDLAVGSYVRITLNSRTGIFTKGYYTHNSEEIFKIKNIDYSQNLPVYTLSDYKNKDIKGIFYRSELTTVIKPDHYIIEKILKKKNIRGQPYFFVKYKGYNSSFNEWITTSQILKV